MAHTHKTVFQFISEPTDVNYGGNVHGGMVMKWIDQVGFACASEYAGRYCVTIYVGGIRFISPISIGDLVRLEAKVIYTGKTSIHIAVDVFSRKMTDKKFHQTTHCVMVFVSMENGKPHPVKPFEPLSEAEIQMHQYAIKLMDLRKDIESEMKPFIGK